MRSLGVSLLKLTHYSLNKKKYILTDEYFNNLSLYNEPVTMFFRGYEPWNLDNQAIVYIIEDDGRTKENKLLFKDSSLNFKRIQGNIILIYS
jgi:hypothetical protein